MTALSFPPPPIPQVCPSNPIARDFVQHPIVGTAGLAPSDPPSIQVPLEGRTAQTAPVRGMLGQGVQIVEDGSRADPDHLLPAPPLVDALAEEAMADAIPEHGGHIPEEEGAGPVGAL